MFYSRTKAMSCYQQQYFLFINSVRRLKGEKGGDYELNVPVGITVTNDDGRVMGRSNTISLSPAPEASCPLTFSLTAWPIR